MITGTPPEGDGETGRLHFQTGKSPALAKSVSVEGPEVEAEELAAKRQGRPSAGPEIRAIVESTQDGF